MQLSRVFSVLGLAAMLGLATVPAAQAAPTDSPATQTIQVQGERRGNQRDERRGEGNWRRYVRNYWDNSHQWYQRNVVIQPNRYFAQPINVRVVVPQPYLQSFATPTFVTAVQQTLLPALVQVVPAEVFTQAPLRFVQVQPGFWVVAHPSLYWGGENPWAAYQYANWLQAYGLSFQPYTFSGPQGYGTYLSFHGYTANGWGF